MIKVFGAKFGVEEEAAVVDVLRRGWAGIGPQVERFEKEFAARLVLGAFAMLDSGSNALYMAIKLLDLPPGSEVIVPSFTWVSCAQAVVLAGHRVVFADVDLDTQNVTAELIQRRVTSKTAAVMVVHYAGLPCQMKGIVGLGLPVVEDAAHAVNSKIDGVSCGKFGKVAIFSFDAVKNLATPEGGGLTSTDCVLVEHAKRLRYCGIESSGFGNSTHKDRWWEYNIVDFFPKCLPNDVSAGIALAQLRKLDVLQARRRELWQFYQREFGEVSWLVTPQEPAEDQQHSYFTYLVRVARKRTELAHYLKANGVYTTLRYHPLHLNPIYGDRPSLPNCECLNETGLNLPLHPAMSDDDAGKVVDLVRNYIV